MMTFIFAPFLLGLDGFLACTALGPQQYVKSHRYRLAAAFGLCDALALVVGGILVNARTQYAVSFANHAAPFLIAAYGVYVAIEAISEGGTGCRRPSLVYLLPVIMSIDNFTAGLVLGYARSSIIIPAIMSILVSSAMALLGLEAGSTVVERVRVSPLRFSAVGLVLIAIGRLSFL
jgi:putative Mn2+ efflux pump MntP